MVPAALFIRIALWILNIEIQIKDVSLSAALQWFFEDRGTCEKQEKEPICRDLQILLKASQMATNTMSWMQLVQCVSRW